MKKMFLSVMLLVGFASVGVCSDQLMLQNTVTWTENPTITYGTVSISSTTVSTSTAVNYGTMRVFQNTGTVNIRYKKGSNSAVGTGGIIIVPLEKVVFDQFMGVIYWAVEAGSSAGSVILETSQTN